MLELAARVRAGESRGQVLVVEHEPVYTAGRATPAGELEPEFVPIERGGKLTYHGPGQLAVYPIVALPKRDVRAWLRGLEQFGVAVCHAFELDAAASVDGTGVFVGGRKVASIGVAIRHWINLHGIAFNVDLDLGAFDRIRPCGLEPQVMTDLSRLCERQVELDEVKAAIEATIWTTLGLRRSSADGFSGAGS